MHADDKDFTAEHAEHAEERRELIKLSCPLCVLCVLGGESLDCVRRSSTAYRFILCTSAVNVIMRLSIIVAMSENRVIGRDNQLPWHLPADLKRFKQLTTGHAVIMGRKTFDSIGKPLPNRRNIIVTRDRDFRAGGIDIAHSLDEAIALARHEEEVFIAGGAEIFREAASGADRIYLTLVHANVEGDVFFPDIDWNEWTLVEDERHEADEAHAYAMSFRRYERVRFGSGQGPV